MPDAALDLRQMVFDALAELDPSIAVLDTPQGDLALIRMATGEAWLVTLKPARLEATG